MKKQDFLVTSFINYFFFNSAGAPYYSIISSGHSAHMHTACVLKA